MLQHKSKMTEIIKNIKVIKILIFNEIIIISLINV